MDLDAFFNPRSIAVIGVSRDPQKVGHLVARNLLAQGYRGDLFFVNPKAERILGKKAYPDLDAIGRTVDLAAVALPAVPALATLDELQAAGVKHAIVYAAGFKEADPDGIKKEALLKSKAREYGLTVLGPNCIGFINTEKRINTTFLKHVAPAGNIGFVSQSGAMGAVLLDYFAARRRLGFSHFISLGNKTVIDESAALGFLADDDRTAVIAMYLEDTASGARLREALALAAAKKPVVILKAGSTKEGARAAVSHTGGLAGDDRVFGAVVEGTGAVRADDYSQFIGLLKMYSFNRLPTSKRVLVLSNAGGVGVLMADRIIGSGLELTTISPKTKNSLKKSFDEVKKITLHNPIDLLGDASAFEYKTAIESTLKETDIGSVVVLLTPQANTEIPQTAKVIKEVQDSFDKPVYPVFMGEKSIEHSHLYFEENAIASFDTYDRLPGLIRKILGRHAFTRQPPPVVQKLSVLGDTHEIAAILDRHPDTKLLDFGMSMEVVKLAGIPTVPFRFLPAKSALPSVEFPAVAKVAAAHLTHKTEVRGVVTHIADARALRRAVRTLEKIPGCRGVYVQNQAAGLEVFLGARRDPAFDTVIVLGFGGIYTELLNQTVLILHPSTRQDFTASVTARPVVAKYFSGYRNLPEVDLEKLWQTALSLGYLLEQFDRIAEVDINPLFATGEGLAAADARIVLR